MTCRFFWGAYYAPYWGCDSSEQPRRTQLLWESGPTGRKQPILALVQQAEHGSPLPATALTATRAMGENNPISAAAGNSKVEACNPAHFLSASVSVDAPVINAYS